MAKAKTVAMPLDLVSPHTRGPVVRNAQMILNGENIFKGDYLQGGKVDGEYGPWTFRATKRAKFWCGFASIDGRFGITLMRYLDGAKPLTDNMKKRREERLADRDRETLGDRIWERAGVDIQKKITEEPPYSNRNYITVQRYHLVGAWCAMAVSVWSKDAGSKIPVMGRRYHYCPTIFADAMAGVNGLSLVKPERLQRGDWILFDWGQDRTADHVGLWGEWIQKGRTMKTREGNTSYEGSAGSQSDGGAAAERKRSISDVARNSRGDYGFVRLGR